MENKNKENARKLKYISKIPLPVQPLPQLPKELVESGKVAPKIEVQHERHPLRTINTGTQLSLPGPSKHVPQKTKGIKKWDSKVTLRHTDEDLDWDYKVFKDNLSGSDDVIVVSDDNEEHSEENMKLTINEEQKNFNEARAFTPALKSLEPSRIKNIKMSLKRPHSRELQGLSPLAKDQKKEGQKVRRSLCFNEPLEERLTSPDFWKKSYMRCLSRDYSKDIFNHLLNQEKKSAVPKISKVLRACVINWLMKVNGPDGNPSIVQSACWYLDSVLGTGQLIVEKLQLICAACYWIANKLQGPGVTASKIVKYSNSAFSTSSLLIAEREILRRLKFPCHPVVPQDYIHYLAWWCDSTHPGEIEVGATFLCMCGIMVDKTLCTEYASVIAAAAVKNCVMLLKDANQLNRLQDCPLFKTAEKKATCWAHTCYILRRSARIVSSDAWEYKAPIEQYGTPPHYIAQRMLNAIHVFYRTKKTANSLEIL